jgi:hypothetical protein
MVGWFRQGQEVTFLLQDHEKDSQRIEPMELTRNLSVLISENVVVLTLPLSTGIPTECRHKCESCHDKYFSVSRLSYHWSTSPLCTVTRLHLSKSPLTNVTA